MALYVGALRYIRVTVLTNSPDQMHHWPRRGECDHLVQARVQLSCLSPPPFLSHSAVFTQLWCIPLMC